MRSRPATSAGRRAPTRCANATRAGTRSSPKLAPQRGFLDAIRAELPEDGIFVDEVTQMGFVARLAFPVYKPRTFLSPGYQDNLGWGFATALGAQNARRDVPVVAISGDGGFMFTANELSTAVRHRIPLVAVVFSDGAFGNVRRIQEERYGNRVIASDLANPDFIRFAESFGAAAERAARSRRAARRTAPWLCPPRRADARSRCRSARCRRRGSSSTCRRRGAAACSFASRRQRHCPAESSNPRAIGVVDLAP